MKKPFREKGLFYELSDRMMYFVDNNYLLSNSLIWLLMTL